MGAKQFKFDDRLAGFLKLARQMCAQEEAAAVMLLLPGPTDWDKLKEHAGGMKILLAADTPDELEGAVEAGLATVPLNMPQAPVIEKLTQGLLAAVALEILAPGAGVAVIYSGFEPETVDSLSFIRLDEHLGRLTARDLKQLVTSVPLETIKIVVDLAVEIGREGREGQPVGTIFVVGDTRKVNGHCQPAGFDPVKGYSRAERDLHDPRVREAVKEVAGLDGAFVVASDGTVEKAAQLIDAPYADLALPKGFGARHWAGAAVSKVTNAIAIVVSQSSGTVRIFQSGECVLRIEPFRQAMKWREFDFEPPQADGE